MDFDHIRDKRINIAEAVNRWPVSRILKEASKCEIVCSNCHRIRTHKRREYKMTEEAVTKKPLTRAEVTELLKKRIRADGTPFKKHEGPRKKRTVTADGLRVALGAMPDEAAKVRLVQSFGLDGRKALRELREAAPGDASLESLFKAAFPGSGTGRPYQDKIKATTDGKAVVSGFENNEVLKVERTEDGRVILTPTGEIVPPKAAGESLNAG